MLIKTGIYAGVHRESVNGWKILCEQEKHPFCLTDAPDTPVLLCEGETPLWLGDYLQQGGAAILTGMEPSALPFESEYVGKASLEYIDLTALDSAPTRIQSTIDIYDGSGFGCLCLHENRLIKKNIHPDEYPAVLFRKVGKGYCWYSGIPFSALIGTLGDTLRSVDDFSGVTERIVSVDKHLLLRAMRKLLRIAYEALELPYVYLHYYPDEYQSLFSFRVDVDGIYGENLGKLCKAASDSGIRTTFYVNRNMCEPEKEELFKITAPHEIGCHGAEHNLYSGEEENFRNVNDCMTWMESLGLKTVNAYVAPRGMWNHSLHRALERLKVPYTSDFGFCVYGFPFYPYFGEERTAVLQIPIAPFSTERASVQAIEEHKPLPDADFVADYFRKMTDEQYALGMPVILYSHPQYFGPLSAQVLPRLKEHISHLNIWQATMQEICDWWKLRDSVSYCVHWDAENGLTVDAALPDRVRLKVIEPRRKTDEYN